MAGFDEKPTAGESEGPFRLFLFGALLALFSVYTGLAVRAGSVRDVRERPVWLTTAAAITGPFVGAIARRGQGCCLAFSLKLVPYCGTVLAIGVLSQFAPMPRGGAGRALRLLLWLLGWLGWFLGIPLSFLHAFF